MMNQANTVSEFTRKAAQEYLQTVVFIDDQIYAHHGKSRSVENAPTQPKSRKKASKRASQPEAQALKTTRAETPEEDNSPDSYDVITHFAKKQIICSPYQPKKGAGATTQSEMFLLCKSADIVILDWNLDDGGKRALELVDGLIKQAMSDVPEQLRLILIYSGEQNLFSVANQLYEKVKDSLGRDLEPLEEGLAFHTENSRVAVLGKPGRVRAHGGEAAVVPESKLADKAIDEFSKLASGLLHAATLLGLAEIRKNSRKILSKFNATLDPGFLTHLAMSIPTENAASHIVPLLVSEIESVLEDALPDPLITNKVIKDWCHNVWEPGEHLAEVFTKPNSDLKEIGESICVEGFKQAKSKHDQIPNLSKSKNIRSASKILLPNADSNSNHLFSHLMSSRTFYDNAPKALRLGTIIFDKAKDRYLLCIQPVCDSVRLKCNRAFIFTQMAKVENGSGNPISHIVVRSDNESIELSYKPKSYLSVSIEFSPDKKSETVTSRKDDSDQIIFKDAADNDYLWIDQLRMAHAQRAVENFARELSRVGLTESEWLRLLDRE